ncbi:hypothetical protein HDV00_007514 [Rhizophlyctis rosea]|nr:hypothetical protein HDV00_007514 [Rhizophlyctis rosea]
MSGQMPTPATFGAARTAVPTIVSRNAKEQRSRVLSLYRDCYRSAPDIIEMYKVAQPVWKLRAIMRQKFDDNLHIRDREIIDVLIFKGRNELTETLNQWKQDDHVHRFFPNDVYAQPERKVRPNEDMHGRGKHSEFLARFWEGNYAKERSDNYS